MKAHRAARTVIFDEEGKVAIIEVRGGEYYKIPGGGIEAEEKKREAAHREAQEEAGCEIRILSKLGEHEFTDENKRKHFSTAYLAIKTKENKGLNFNDWELSNKFKLMWVDPYEAIELFEKSDTDDEFGKEINKRDLNFLKNGFEKYIGTKR